MKRCLVLVLLLCSLTVQSCSRVSTNKLLVDRAHAETFAEEFSRPHKAQIAYSARSDGSWTNWNKFWLSAAVGGQVADTVSTARALDRGCKEANPLFGSNPSTGTIVAFKIGALGLAYLVTEYWLPEESRQSARNWVYGALGAAGFAAAGWNSAQDCR